LEILLHLASIGIVKGSSVPISAVSRLSLANSHVNLSKPNAVANAMIDKRLQRACDLDPTKVTRSNGH
jgi:hypothetical protein